MKFATFAALVSVFTTGATAAISAGPYHNLTVSTVTDIKTTTCTVTSCDQNKCSLVTVETGLTTITKGATVYTTYCPLTSVPWTTATRTKTVCDDKCHPVVYTTICPVEEIKTIPNHYTLATITKVCDANVCQSTRIVTECPIPGTKYVPHTVTTSVCSDGKCQATTYLTRVPEVTSTVTTSVCSDGKCRATAYTTVYPLITAIVNPDAKPTTVATQPPAATLATASTPTVAPANGAAGLKVSGAFAALAVALQFMV